MTQSLIALAEKYLVPTYARPQIVFTHGEGAYLYDDAGNRYLDFVAGIAVNALGHADPAWAQVVAEQATQLTHLSNLYHNIPQLLLAQKLVENSFADKLFFSNTGSEANEAALKFARKYARTHHGEGKTDIVAFSHSFHGRTMGALSVTHKAKYREPFAPLVPGVTFVEYNDLAGASAVIGPETCAVIVEPVQGEGGVHAAAANFLRGLRALCDEQDALLIFDEVQCGMGRTGYLWAYQALTGSDTKPSEGLTRNVDQQGKPSEGSIALGVTPDMMTIAKPLAGGLPIGAALVTDKVAAAIQPGDHGSTFAGGPLVCAAALHVFDRVNQPAFLSHVQETGTYLRHRLETLESDKVLEVRGLGLMVGLELNGPVADVVAAARSKGLLLVNAGDNVIRFVPPLTVTRPQVDEAMEVLSTCLN